MYAQLLLDALITTALVSSFFIFPSHGQFAVALQPFYLFTACVFLLFAYEMRDGSARATARSLFREHGWPLLIFSVAGALTIAFARAASRDGWPDFSGDYLRTLLLILLFIITAYRATRHDQLRRFITVALFTPLVFTPLLFIGRVESVQGWLPDTFFSAYKLQGFQSDNPTALGAWLVLPFAASIHFLFVKNSSRHTRVLAFLGSIASLALILWSNSRGGLLAALLMITIVVWLYENNLKNRLQVIVISILVIILSVCALPQQARIGAFVRLYPSYYNEAISAKFALPFSFVGNRLWRGLDITANQDRGVLWRPCLAYIATHPFGEYGPSLPYEGRCGQHNSFFQAAFWGGWAGLLALIWFTFSLARRGWQLIRGETSQALYGAFVLGLGGVFVQAMLNSFIQFKPLWLVAAIVAAAGYRQRRRTE